MLKQSRIVDHIEYVPTLDYAFKLFLYYKDLKDYNTIILHENYISSGYEFRKKLKELEKLENLNIKNHEYVCQMAIQECLKAGVKNIEILIN
jgi:hypothetical protein